MSKRIVVLLVLVLVSACEAGSEKVSPTLNCQISGAVAVLSGIIDSFENHKEISTYTREEIIRILKQDRDGIAELATRKGAK